MVFSSIPFLFVYLPVMLAVHYLAPVKWRNAVLLLFSLLFYGWGARAYLLLLVGVAALDYAGGLLIGTFRAQGKDRAAKAALITTLALNLGILAFFKYWGAALPLGLSFYTFQTMTYPIDVYRGDAAPQKNLLKFGLFAALFPSLLAGPIHKYKELSPQIESRTWNTERFASGVVLFVIGLAKKVLLGNNLAVLWTTVNALPAQNLTVLGAWLGAVAFSLHLYFDFSGYSDMAVGLGRMLGFDLRQNFNYPYEAQSAADFWRRWHISLGAWFRDYLYIPLGGNRVSEWRGYLNLLIVWAVTGIWHGASWNFLLWGLYFALFLILEKAFLGRFLARLPAWARQFYALLVVVVSWVIFAIEDFSHLGIFLKAMFGFAQGGFTGPEVGYWFQNFFLVLFVAVLASSSGGAKLWNRMGDKPKKLLQPVLLLAALVLCTAYLTASGYSPFLYLKF